MSGQSSYQRASASASASSGNTRMSEELRTLLETRYEDVFETSDDGLTYVKPDSLRGVPVARAGEGSPYWQSNWSSLDDFMAGEQNQEDLKRRAVAKLQANPDDKQAKKERKIHMDNVSHHRKIREVFGLDQRAHPNQVVAARFLPVAGLCEQNIMYHMGCKVSDLQTLSNSNLLAMDPWDFYRWRVGKVLMDRQRGLLPGSKKDGTRGVINSLDSERGSDPLFREAVIYSARLQGRSAAYGSKKKPSAGYKQAGQTILPPRSQSLPKKASLQRRLGSSPSTSTMILTAPRNPSSSAAGFAERRRAEQEKIKAERRARLSKQTTGYAGVQAFRYQLSSKNDSESDAADSKF